MRRFLQCFFLGAVIFFCFLSHAQDFAEPMSSEWQKFVDQVHGAQGMSYFVGALLLVQFIFLLLRTVIGEMLGIHRLLVLAILSLGATISANILSGKSVIDSVLMDAGTLWSYQVLFHQLKRQWEKRDEDRTKLSDAGLDQLRKGDSSE